MCNPSPPAKDAVESSGYRIYYDSNMTMGLPVRKAAVVPTVRTCFLLTRSFLNNL